ncbi:MAG: hypothetical protein CXR31_00920 [Geobacter sp.]|nr:MAG: hypothetical protein CXR31_00920 [Geobacter sp.]
MIWRLCLFVKNNLRLLLEEFVKLNKTPYFNREINAYLLELIEFTEELIANYNTLPADATRLISKILWSAAKYLSGTSIHKVPYEIVYCLKLALDDWNSDPKLITTALTDDPDFHFMHVNPGVIINLIYPGKNTNKDIIQIAFPTLYRHRPLYIIALYHELGHFIDKQFKITDWSFRSDPVPKDQRKKEEAHRSEYFSDLFAASYAGKAYLQFLNNFAPGDPTTDSHPSTADRIDNLNAFLESRNNTQIDRINNVLLQLGKPLLALKYTKPALTDCFDNLRPYTFKNTNELHGIFEAGFDYLQSVQSAPNQLWSKFDEFKRDKVVNDLVEKSIRNKMITEEWSNATA